MMKSFRSALFWVYYFIVISSCLIITTVVFLLTFWFDTYRFWPNKMLRFLSMSMICVNPGWKTTIVGTEHYEKGEPVIFISNHQGFMDMPLLYLLPWQMKWVSKKSLFKVPILGWLISLTGHLAIDRQQKGVVKQLFALEKPVKEGVPVMIFPEGTRTMNGDVKSFKNGAFMMATKLDVPVQPVIIDGSFQIFPSGEWKFKFQQPLFVKITPKIYPSDFNSIEEFKEACHYRIVNELDNYRLQIRN